MVRASYEWQVSYQIKAQVLYDTYLKWLHESPVDLESGELVLNALFAKELPVEPCRALSGVPASKMTLSETMLLMTRRFRNPFVFRGNSGDPVLLVTGAIVSASSL